MEVTTRKTSKSKAKKLYNELIQKDIDVLEREKSNDIRKYNILDILNNVGLVFTGDFCITKMCLKKQCFKEVLWRE